MQNLFGSVPENPQRKPLAERMRPSTLEEVLGQDHIVGAKGFLSAVL